MNRIVLWCLSTVSVLVLLFGYHTSTSSTMPASPSVSVISGSRPGTSAGSAGSSRVTGSVAMTQRGPVQVRLTMDGATIVDLDVVQYPSGNQKSSEISAYALPILIQETLDAQSTDIDMVSGATVTNAGYVQSLQSALDKAKA